MFLHSRPTESSQPLLLNVVIVALVLGAVLFALVLQIEPASAGTYAQESPVPIVRATVEAVAALPPAPTPADPSVIWDARLPAFQVSLKPANVSAGTQYWKLIRVDFNDPYQHCGDFGADHDMYWVLLDEKGGRVINHRVTQQWPDGSTDTYSDNRGIADIAIWASYDPAKSAGPYQGFVDGVPSDTVVGMGLPLKHHVSFILYFQKALASAYPTRTPTPTGPWSSPTPTRTPTLACLVSNTVTPTPKGGPGPNTPTFTPTAPRAATATPTNTRTPVAPPTATPTRTRMPVGPTPTNTLTPVAPPTPTQTNTPAACKLSPVTNIPVGAHPKGLAVDPATNRVFIGLADSSSVAVVDASSNKRTATWATDGAGNTNGLAFTQGELFVAKRNNAKVSVLNTNTGSLVKNITVGNAPYGVGASGGRAWVANFNSNSVSLIDAVANTLVSTVSSGASPSLVTTLGNRAYITSYGTGVMDVDSNNGVKTIKTGSGSFGVAANSATNRVYVSNRDTRTISVVDAATDNIVSTFAESATPYALAVNPSTNHLFIVLADLDLLRVRDATTHALIADLPLDDQGANGGDTIGVLGNLIYVGNNAAGTVSVISDCGN